MQKPKNRDVRLAEIHASSRRWVVAGDVIRTAFWVFGILGSIWLIFEGIKPYAGAAPESVAAVARLIEAMNVYNIFGVVVGGLGLSGVVLGRRAVVKERNARIKAEAQLEILLKYEKQKKTNPDE